MPQVTNQIILRGAGSSIQRTPEQGGAFAHHFRWEQCPAGRHGCVRHLMSPAGCLRFSLDHFFLSLYSYHLLLALPSFVALISPAFPPASLFVFSFSTHLCPYQLFCTFSPCFNISHPPQTLSVYLPFSSSSPSSPTAYSPWRIQQSSPSAVCRLGAEVDSPDTLLCLPHLHFFQHFCVTARSRGLEYNITS